MCLRIRDATHLAEQRSFPATSPLHSGDAGEEAIPERLQSFLRFALARGRRSPMRRPDAIAYLRWVDRSPSAFRLAGKVGDLPASALQTFWLEVSEQGAPGQLRWTLHNGIDSATAGPGIGRNAADLLASPARARWALTLTGD